MCVPRYPDRPARGQHQEKGLARIMHELPAATAAAASSRNRMARGRVICSTKAHSRGNTQAGPAARQAGKEAKRESIKMRRTACISRLSRISRSERSEGMRFAPQTIPASAEPGLVGRSPCGCAVARPSPRSRNGVARIMRASEGHRERIHGRAAESVSPGRKGIKP